jgi:hypothetical protein
LFIFACFVSFFPGSALTVAAQKREMSAKAGLHRSSHAGVMVTLTFAAEKKTR